jgi:hypothetical protein
MVLSPSLLKAPNVWPASIRSKIALISRARSGLIACTTQDRGGQHTSLMFTRDCRAVGGRGLDRRHGKLLQQPGAGELSRHHQEGPHPPPLMVHLRPARAAVFEHIEAICTASPGTPRSATSQSRSSRTALCVATVRDSPLRGSDRWIGRSTRRKTPPKTTARVPPNQERSASRRPGPWPERRCVLLRRKARHEAGPSVGRCR